VKILSSPDNMPGPYDK